MKSSNTQTVLLAGALGFAAGVLLAPRSGPETRQKLRVQTEEAKTRMRNATDELKRQATEKTDDIADQVGEAADTAKQKTRTIKETVTKHAGEAENELKQQL